MSDTGRTVEKLGADERAALQETMEEHEDILRNVDGLGGDYIQDKDRLQGSINRAKRILARDEALVPKTAADKAKFEAEIKRLKELIAKDMPSVREMNSKMGSPEAERATRRNMLFHQKHNRNLLRLKHLLRCIDPDDPFAGDLERIRPV